MNNEYFFKKFFLFCKLILINFELKLIVAESYYSINLFGTINKQGYYYSNIYIGTPPQKQSLIIDTGSSQISLSCSKCLNCGSHEYPPFNISESSSSIKCKYQNSDNYNSCSYFYYFSEGSSISGKYFSDILRFEQNEQEKNRNLLGFKYDFIGCNDFETKNFLKQNASGILGLGLKKNSDNSMNFVHTLLSSTKKLLNLKNSNKIVISLCLLETGGKIKIGEYNYKIVEDSDFNSKTQLENIIWIPLIYPSIFYKIKLKNIIINNKYSNENIDNINAIIDLGSTFTYLPSKIYNDLIFEFSKICNLINQMKSKKCQITNQSLCWKNLSSIYNLFPIIQLEFAGQRKTINWFYNSYLYNNGNKWWCLGIKEHNSQNEIIMGISFFKNKQLILDLYEKRVGINIKVIKSCQK